MRDTGLVNILCGNELIIAQMVNAEEHTYKSLNITMGEVNAFDIIEAAPNENGILEFVAIVEEGIPHKKMFFFKTTKDWMGICAKANEHREKCLAQGLTMPRGTDPGTVMIAYEDGFDVNSAFTEFVQEVPEE